MGPAISAGVPRLWKALRTKGWSQGDLATALGTTTSLVNRWLHGDRRPGRRFAREIERVMGVPVDAWDAPVPPTFELRPTGSDG